MGLLGLEADLDIFCLQNLGPFEGFASAGNRSSAATRLVSHSAIHFRIWITDIVFYHITFIVSDWLVSKGIHYVDRDQSTSSASKNGGLNLHWAQIRMRPLGLCKAWRILHPEREVRDASQPPRLDLLSCICVNLISTQPAPRKIGSSDMMASANLVRCPNLWVTNIIVFLERAASRFWNNWSSPSGSKAELGSSTRTKSTFPELRRMNVLALRFGSP